MFSCHITDRTASKGILEINIPSKIGNYTGTPFLRHIPIIGKEPVRLSVQGLPKGIKLDRQNRTLRGYTPTKGNFEILIIAENEYGKASKKIDLTVGDTIALTPPMGWNSWNSFNEDISAHKIKSMADAMVSSGMRDVGYEYIIIDDGWMTDRRDGQGHIIIDSTKFPNGIRDIADYVHNLGLKFGIYSSPSNRTCLGLMGSKGFEKEDVEDYANWG